MKTITFNHVESSEPVTMNFPDEWPMDACAEVAAFRLGYEPGDLFSFHEDQGVVHLIVQGVSV